MSTTSLGPILYSFIEDHLKIARRLKPVSIRSYRDTLRLFLQYVGRNVHRKVSCLLLVDFTLQRVLGFLNHLEAERHNRIQTRNQRLAALHTFFEYIAIRVPELHAVAEQVHAIPVKRVAPPQTRFLERDEVSEMFSKMPTTGWEAMRDRALLLFLYNTGARVQELVDLRIKNLALDPPCHVQLHGKGDKWRSCPLWTEAADQLRLLLKEQGTVDIPDSPVFVSRSGTALTRFGVYKLVRRYTQHLETQNTEMKRHHISPHVFRHTTAVHLLEAGNEVNVIRGWLGHVSLDTTNRYAEISTRAKEEALRRCEPPTGVTDGFPRRPVWRNDQSLLNWLNSL